MQVKLVFLDSFPAYWDEERLKEDLKKYNENEKFQLLKKLLIPIEKIVFLFISLLERKVMLLLIV